MIINDPKLFDDAAQELLAHVNHKMSTSVTGGDAAPESVGIFCEDCQTCLIEFLPEPTTERPNPDKVKYEGHYDSLRDVCYVEVFKPGNSPYPLQERQDIINKSPTGIAWGYGGSAPAQCAFAILMDYFGDEAKARALYHPFKSRVVAAFPQNGEWTLTGREIERAISLLERSRPAVEQTVDARRLADLRQNA